MFSFSVCIPKCFGKKSTITILILTCIYICICEEENGWATISTLVQGKTAVIIYIYGRRRNYRKKSGKSVGKVIIIFLGIYRTKNYRKKQKTTKN